MPGKWIDILQFITYKAEYLKGITGKYLLLPIIQNTTVGVDFLTFLLIMYNLKSKEEMLLKSRKLFLSNYSTLLNIKSELKSGSYFLLAKTIKMRKV